MLGPYCREGRPSSDDDDHRDARGQAKTYRPTQSLCSRQLHSTPLAKPTANNVEFGGSKLFPLSQCPVGVQVPAAKGRVRMYNPTAGE